MPRFMVTFSKEIDVTCEAESLEEMRAAAQAEADDDLCCWDTSGWNFEVHLLREMRAGANAECAVSGGRIVNAEEVAKP